MGIEVQPFHEWTRENNEASASIEAGMVVDTAGLKATSAEDIEGVNKFETAPDDQCTLGFGEVLVQVTGTGSAQAKLTISATAGKLQATTTTGNLVWGFALEAWTAAATIKALIRNAPYPHP